MGASEHHETLRQTAILETIARVGRLSSKFRWRRVRLFQGRRIKGASVSLGRRSVVSVRPGGVIHASARSTIDHGSTLRVHGQLTIGSDCYLGPGCHISCMREVTIGDSVRFGERVSVHDENHVFEPIGQTLSGYTVASITIERGAWLGANVVVLPGVTIGEYSVVAAGSVVSRSIPAGTLAAGMPATVKRVLT